jgi:hypothetical protein
MTTYLWDTTLANLGIFASNLSSCAGKTSCAWATLEPISSKEGMANASQVCMRIVRPLYHMPVRRRNNKTAARYPIPAPPSPRRSCTLTQQACAPTGLLAGDPYLEIACKQAPTISLDTARMDWMPGLLLPPRSAGKQHLICSHKRQPLDRLGALSPSNGRVDLESAVRSLALAATSEAGFFPSEAKPCFACLAPVKWSGFGCGSGAAARASRLLQGEPFRRRPVIGQVSAPEICGSIPIHFNRR